MSRRKPKLRPHFANARHLPRAPIDAQQKALEEREREGRYHGAIVDVEAEDLAPDADPTRFARADNLMMMRLELLALIDAQRFVPPQRGRPTDYEGKLEVVDSIIAAGVTFSTARDSLCEKAVIKARLAKIEAQAVEQGRKPNRDDTGESLASWAHDALRQLSDLAKRGDPPRADDSPG